MSKVTRLKILREKQFSSQALLAKELGVSQGEVSLLERNLTTPRAEVQKHLEEIFKLPYEQLAEEIDLEKLLV